jgi:glycosyltransferase involved in cell wall biosynthesis
MIAAIDARLISSRSTGDSAYWTGLAHGLSRLPHPDLKLLLISNAPRPREIPDDPRLEWISAPGGSERWWSMARFPAIARRRGAGIAHTQYSLSPLLGRRGISTFHDVSFMIEPAWFPAKDAQVLRIALRLAAKTAGRIITVSQASREEIHQAEPRLKGRVEAVWNALPASFPRLDREEAEALRRDAGAPESYCLTVGTRWPRKNMDLAVQAMDRLPAAMPHRLLVTGKAGWGSQELGARGQATGWVDDRTLAALYDGAALYLAPSLHEGFGIPILEAFASGCPVICGRGGAMPEVAGGAAKLAASYDAGIWAQEIERLLADPEARRDLAALGRERLGAFSWEASAALTWAIYRRTAKGDRRLVTDSAR